MKKALVYIILSLCVFAAHAQKPRSKTDSVKQELKTLEVEKLLIQANLSKNNSDFHRALELYSAALSIDKTSAVAYYEMAGLFMYSKAFANAAQYAQKAVYYNPSQAAYVERLAQVYMLQGNQKKLQETLKLLKKLEQSPSRGFVLDAKAEQTKGEIAGQARNDGRQARNDGRQARNDGQQVDYETITTASYEQLLQNPTHETIYKIVTENYFKKEPVAWDSIALVNEMATHYFPGMAEYYLQAARAYYETAHYEKAVQVLNAALENSFADDEQKKEIHSLLAKAHEFIDIQRK